MELSEKLLELRKQKGLTQEELANYLYVSRTAISKWESGRGTPNIDSLKAISAFFSISLDSLLSTDDLLIIAENEKHQQSVHARTVIFGLLDISMVLLFILPCFGQRVNGSVSEVALLSLNNIQPYLKSAYLLSVCTTVLFGILTLAFQNTENSILTKYRTSLSLFIHICLVFLFLISRQPYAAVFTFTLLLFKGILLLQPQ